MRRQMDYSKIEDIAKEAATHLGTSVDYISMWAWQELFGSTAGPRKGALGGAAMTWFQVLAFESEDGQGIMWCAGEWKPWTHREQKWNG